MSTGASIPGQYSRVTSVARLAIHPPATRPDGGALAQVSPSAVPTFEEIYEEHFDLVWRMARRLGVPEASVDDVVQDTFLVLHRQLPTYDPTYGGRSSLRAWLLGMLYKVVADHRRRFRRKESQCVPHASDSQDNVAIASSLPPPNESVEQAETVRLLEDLLAELDEEKREILVLAQIEEMTVPEIAEALGANVNTVYARLRAARRDFDAAYARHKARASHDLRNTRRVP